MKSRFFVLSLCLIFLLGLCASVNAKEKAADSQKETAAAAADAIPEVPENGTLEEYKEYIEKLNEAFRNKARIMINVAQANHVSFRSEEFSKPFNSMAKEYMDRIFQATDKALLLKDVSDKDCEELVNRKIQLLQALSQINNDGEDAFTAELEALAAQLRKIGKTKLAENIEGKLLQNKIIGYVRSGDVKKFSKIAAEIDEKVEKAGKDITPPLAVQAMIIVLGAKDLKEYKAPEDRQAKYLKALSEASDSEVQKLAFQLESAIRRAEGEKRFKEVLGNEFKFGGTFTDGSEYKAEDYAGKVVLIDFWATWCGPCCDELSNVKKMYKAYHDKGFEVIGVSLDDPDKAEKNLNTFLKFNDIPWKQMYDKKAVVPGEKNKDGKPVTVSEYYAINSIPCPILIGKDGKVISLNARDIELKEQLVKIYGKVEGLDDDDEDADDEDDQAADEAIPDVPENGTLADYREYVKKVNGMLDKKANRLERQAKKNGVDPLSEEYANSWNEMGTKYYSLMEKAVDKAILLKDISDEEFDALYVMKLQLIQILTQLSNKKVDTFKAKTQALVDQLRKMGKEELAKDLEVIILRVKMHEYVESKNVEEFAKAALEVDERVKNAGKDITPDLAQTAILTVMGASELPEYKAPEGRLEKYFKVLSESSNPDVKPLTKVLEQRLNAARLAAKFDQAEDDDAIPEVPENLTYERYKEYVKELYDMYSAQGRKMARQAHEDGVDSQSKEFGNAIEAMSQKYFSRIEQALDKALLLKDLTDEQFEDLAIEKVRLVMINDDDKTIAKAAAFIDQLRKTNKAKLADIVDFHFIQTRVYKCKAKRDVKTLAKIAAEIDEQIDNAGENISPVLAKKAAVIVGALQDAVFLAQRMKKYNMAISKAINAKDITDEDLSELAVGKLRLIALSAGNNPEDVKTLIGKMEAFVEQLRKMDKEKAADEAEDIVFQFKINLYISRGDVKEFAKVAAKIDKKVEKVGKDINLILAQNMLTVIQAGMAIPNYTAPEGRLEKYCKALSNASDPKVKSAANVLERILSNVKAKSAKGDLDKLEK